MLQIAAFLFIVVFITAVILGIREAVHGLPEDFIGGFLLVLVLGSMASLLILAFLGSVGVLLGFW